MSFTNFSINNTDFKYVLKSRPTVQHHFLKIFNLSQDLNGVTCVSLKKITRDKCLTQFRSSDNMHIF